MHVFLNLIRCQSVGNFNFHSISPGKLLLRCNPPLEETQIFNFVKVDLSHTKSWSGCLWVQEINSVELE